MFRRTRSAALMGAAVVSALVPALALQPAHAAASCAPAQHVGGDWPSFGHDLANTRSQPDEHVIGVQQAPTLKPAWTFQSAAAGGSGGITGTPVVADGCVFTGTDGGWVHALNADTGEVVWSRQITLGGVNASLTVVGGKVYGLTSRTGAPGAFALDEATGAVSWTRVLDTQPGADAYASPVVFGGVVLAGWSGGAAELGSNEAERYAFQGGYVLLDAATGAVVRKQYTVHPPNLPADDLAGGAIWSTAAVDTDTGYAYVGTGNPFNPANQDTKTDAILKIDLDKTRTATFGRIVGHYQGNVDEYFTEFSSAPCVDIPGNPAPWYPQGGGSCFDSDMDFGASPNIFTVDGKKLVGDGQKSGVYHAVDATTMAPAWKSVVGAPTAIGGIVGTAAWDGASLVGPVTTGGYLWSIDGRGGPRWASPTADGAHWGHQVSVANGVAYTTDSAGFLNGYDAKTGALLLHSPIDSSTANASLGAGVSVARNSVYAPAGGALSAFRPQALPVAVPDLPTPPGGGGGGAPAVNPVILSGPGAFITNYATPAMVVQQGGSVTYVNADATAHDVQAYGVYGPDTNRWCEGAEPGKCPAFWTPLIGLSGTSPVYGVSALKPGQYPFYCSLHPGMKGTLVVV
ncbi:MAG: hypothetical protein QOI20_1020 [Acidimicrobiaceae bacterium]|jgi:polyvinyl alcohol dehydrogenase (cytochrome)|nr:hypothetical protein [Acidimicrobiaceae bacterium]